jgi:hypothetical protein
MLHSMIHSKKKLTHFATKSSEIIISSRTAGSTLQKRSLLYKKQKMYSCIRVVPLYLKKPSQTEIEKLLKKIVEVPFSFLLYKIVLKLKLL